MERIDELINKRYHAMTLLLKKTTEKGYEFKYVESYVEKITHKETPERCKESHKIEVIDNHVMFYTPKFVRAYSIHSDDPNVKEVVKAIRIVEEDETHKQEKANHN